jgi:hypothetical protein
MRLYNLKMINVKTLMKKKKGPQNTQKDTEPFLS